MRGVASRCSGACGSEDRAPRGHLVLINKPSPMKVTAPPLFIGKPSSSLHRTSRELQRDAPQSPTSMKEEDPRGVSWYGASPDVRNPTREYDILNLELFTFIFILFCEACLTPRAPRLEITILATCKHHMLVVKEAEGPHNLPAMGAWQSDASPAVQRPRTALRLGQED